MESNHEHGSVCVHRQSKATHCHLVVLLLQSAKLEGGEMRDLPWEWHE